MRKAKRKTGRKEGTIIVGMRVKYCITISKKYKNLYASIHHHASRDRIIINSCLMRCHVIKREDGMQVIFWVKKCT
jgi:hypothetical protein